MHANRSAQGKNAAARLPAALLLVIALAACDKADPPVSRVEDSGAAAVARVAKQAVGLAPKPDPKELADKALAERVRGALATARGLHAHAIDVMARDGRIGLFGTAETESERSLAGKVAGEVAGVEAVTNAIKVIKGS